MCRIRMPKRPSLVRTFEICNLLKLQYLHVCLAFKPFVDENAQSNPNRVTPAAKVSTLSCGTNTLQRSFSIFVVYPFYRSRTTQDSIYYSKDCALRQRHCPSLKSPT